MFLLRFFVGVLGVFAAGCVFPVVGLRALAQSTDTVINVLCPAGFFPAELVRTLEQELKVAVRVEFILDPRETSRHVMETLRRWDVIVADTGSLDLLMQRKQLRELPVDLRSQGEKSHYVPLMRDPLGLAWRPESAPVVPQATWNWLVDPSLNPRWRNQVFLTLDWHLLSSLADVAVAGDSAKKTRWLERLFIQVPRQLRQSLPALLAETVSVGPLWASQYFFISRLMPNLKFVVPDTGTLYREFGAAIAARSAMPPRVTQFFSRVTSQASRLADFNGLGDYPLSNAISPRWKMLPVPPRAGEDAQAQAALDDVAKLFAKINRGTQ